MAAKRAAVYRLKDRILVHPWQETEMGLGIAAAPYASLPLDAAADALGDGVLAALAESGKEVPHPSSWKGQSAPLLKAAGVRSEKALHTGSRYLMVEREGKTLRIEPSRNGGTKGDTKGFEPLPQLAISLDAGAAPEALGAAIRAALERCA
jgi:hypothetical protein